MNGAELANVMNESAIITARNKKSQIEPEDI
jgi:ATP-dependent Zn protease